jgi:hypothetical protein
MTQEQVEELLEVLTKISDSLEKISLCLDGATAVLDSNRCNPLASDAIYAIRTLPLSD